MSSWAIVRADHLLAMGITQFTLGFTGPGWAIDREPFGRPGGDARNA